MQNIQSFVKNKIVNILLSKNFFIIVLFACSYLSNALTIVNSIVFPFVLIPWASILVYKTYKNIEDVKIYNLKYLFLVTLYYFIIGIYHYINRKAPIDSTLNILWSMIMVFFVCYPNYKKDINAINFSIKIILNGIIIFACILSIIGIYTAISGDLIFISEFHFAGIRPDMMRLYVFEYPNAVGIVCAYAILLSLYLLYNTRFKFLYISSVLLNFIAMALTQTRTALLILMALVFLYSFFYFYSYFSRKNKKNISVSLLSFIISLISVFFIYFAHNAIVDLYALNLKNQKSKSNIQSEFYSSPIISKVFAEDIDIASENKDNTRIIVKDMVSGFNSFSDRTTIWAAGLNFIKNEPEVLITGTLTDHIMTKVNSFNTKVPKKIFGSIHNSYLDVLIIGGLPSFLLLFIFFIKLLPKQLKLLFCNLSDFKGGNKIFTIMVWSIAAYGMMESNLIYSNGVVNILLFVFLGYSTFMANHYIAQKD